VVDPDAAFLHAAADPTRLAILRELSSEGPCRACDLTFCCNVHQPTVSHHLRILREAGWVRSERHGTSISYELCADAVERFRQIAGDIRSGGERVASTFGPNPPQPVMGADRPASHSRTKPIVSAAT
jgi:DNA-binding transcriptional ArsR family regulator